MLTNIRENNFFSLHRPYVHISTICTTSQSYQYKIKGRKPSYSCLFLCVSNDPLKMGSSPTLALSLLIFFLCNLCAIQGSIFIQPVTTVVIFNQIEYGIPVTVHCKSKNDDLGVHVLPLGQGYSFKFRPNLVGTTLFFCSFRWTGQTKSTGSMSSTTKGMQGNAPHADGSFMNIACACKTRKTLAKKFAITTEIRSQALLCKRNILTLDLFHAVVSKCLNSISVNYNEMI